MRHKGWVATLKWGWLGVMSLLSGGHALAQDAPAPYQNVEGVAGVLTSVGSDTFANLVTYWSKRYAALS